MSSKASAGVLGGLARFLGGVWLRILRPEAKWSEDDMAAEDDAEVACRNCVFWEQNHSGVGWCRRFPSSPGGRDLEGVVTSHEDWCGEFCGKRGPK